MSGDKIHIFLASDENYAQHSGVVIASILYNHKKSGLPIVLHYLYGGVTRSNREKIEEIVEGYDNAEIVFHDMGGMFEGVKMHRHVTHATYYRLMIPELAPSEVKKAIYLDIDIIVTGDVEELWNVNVDHYAIGAVEDAGLRDIMKDLKKTLAIPEDVRYFNAGILLMNLAYWREKCVKERLLNFLHNFNLPHPNNDQDALNSVLWSETLFIDPKWNVHKEVFHHYYLPDRDKRLTKDFIEAVRQPAIVHFTGRIKPWHYGCGIPYAELYTHYVDMTPWAGFRSADKTWKGFRKKMGWKIKRFLFK